MKIMDLTKKHKRIAIAAISLHFLLPSVSLAADFGGGVRAGVSSTDNVRLDTSPGEIDDIVFQASPYLSFVHDSPGLEANAQYTFDWFRYSDLKSTSKYHRGDVSVTGKAWQDSLTAQIGARRSQVLSDPEDVIPSNRLPLSGNLIDEDEWWFNPKFNRELGSSVSLDANYMYSKIQYGDSSRQDNANQLGNLSLENYRAGQGMTWALRYDWNRTEYEISTPWEYQRATVELGFWVNAKARMFGAGGKESDWDDPLSPALEDSFWEAGAAYSPSENLSTEFAIGERGFGSSWRGVFDYTFKRGSMSLSYDESPTTTGFSRSGEARTVLDRGEFDDYLDRPGSAERYLSKRFQWNLDLKFRRSGFNLSVFDEERADRIFADGTPVDDQSQTGVRASFSWQAGVKTELLATGSLVDRETGDGNKSKFMNAGLSVSYRVGARSDISLGYSYSEQQSRGDNPGGRDYVANVVSLFFTYSM